MAAPVSPQVLPDDAVVMSLYGRRYVFANEEDARAWLNQPLSDLESERWQRAMEDIERLRQEVLARTGGKGVSAEDIDEALREARDH